MEKQRNNHKHYFLGINVQRVISVYTKFNNPSFTLFNQLSNHDHPLQTYRATLVKQLTMKCLAQRYPGAGFCPNFSLHMARLSAAVWSQVNFSNSYPPIALIKISEAWKSITGCHFHLTIFILRNSIGSRKLLSNH